MEELLSLFPIESIIVLALTLVEIFLMSKSATKNRRQEIIYTNLAVVVLLIMLIIMVKYLKDVI